MILQGADEGIEDVRDSVGWTAAVSEETGNFVVTAAADEQSAEDLAKKVQNPVADLISVPL